jgi:hypothetical protein
MVSPHYDFSEIETTNSLGGGSDLVRSTWVLAGELADTRGLL